MQCKTHTIDLWTKEAQVEDLFSGLCVLSFCLFFGLKNARKNQKLVNLLCQASKGWAHSLLQERAI